MSGLPAPLTEQGQAVGDVWRIFLIAGAAVGLLVVGLLTVILFRFRRRADGLPEQVHYRIKLEIAYTVVPLLAVAGLFTITLTSLSRVDATSSQPDLVVDVVASQWQWRFRYPDSGVTVERVGATESPVLVLPTGSTVEFHLESDDVIHSFWVPGFLVKRDVIPGRPQTMQATVDGPPGRYPGVCAEFCGLDHTSMRFEIEIVEPAGFESWLTAQAEGAP